MRLLGPIMPTGFHWLVWQIPLQACYTNSWWGTRIILPSVTRWILSTFWGWYMTWDTTTCIMQTSLFMCLGARDEITLFDHHFAGGVFQVLLSFSEDFNTAPPKIHFMTVPFHPNGTYTTHYLWTGGTLGWHSMPIVHQLSLASCNLLWNDNSSSMIFMV